MFLMKHIWIDDEDELGTLKGTEESFKGLDEGGIGALYRSKLEFLQQRPPWNKRSKDAAFKNYTLQPLKEKHIY